MVLFQQERTTAPFLHDKRNFGEHNKICRSGADEEEGEWVARRVDRTSVSEHAAGVVPGAGEQENDPSKAPCFSPTHRLAELHNPDRGT